MLRLAYPNPSPRQWLLIGGLALGGMAVGGTAWWLLRRRKDQPVEGIPFIHPVTWGLDSSGQPQRVAEDPAICQRWHVGNNRLPWGPEQWGKIEDAVDASMAANFEPYDSVAEARTVAFRITAAALKSLCPTWPVPKQPSQVEAYRTDPDLGFWWESSWDPIYLAAWNRVVAEGGGSL